MRFNPRLPLNSLALLKENYYFRETLFLSEWFFILTVLGVHYCPRDSISIGPYRATANETKSVCTYLCL